MPEQTHPPYVSGSLTIPRQLIRWLDVNPQNGALTRTQTYITVLPFSVEQTWKGYSEIIATYNVLTTNNFSLRGNFTTPTNPNYVLCIMWMDDEFVTHRYAMWRGVDEVFYFDVPLYSGQLIKKNFRFEIWSNDTTPTVEVDTLEFYTSVLGNVDYRFGVDSDLGTNSNIIVDFNAINTPIDLSDYITPVFQWMTTQGLVDAGSNFTSWTDIIDARVLLPTGAIGVTPAIGTTLDVDAVVTTNASSIGTDLTTYGDIVGLVAFNIRLGTGAATGIVYTDTDGGLSINYDNTGKFQLWDGAGYNIEVDDIVESTWYVVIAIAGRLAVYNMQTGVLVGTSSGSSAIGPVTTIALGNTSSQLIEFILSSTTLSYANFNQIVSYFTQKYFTAFSLPLTFPTNSVPLTN